MAMYIIESTRETLRGTFSRDYPPILTIDPGDSVRFSTLDAGWNLEPPSKPAEERQRFEPRVPGQDDGHPMCGPIAIRGAEPGMTLEIQIGDIRPGSWGWTGGGGQDNKVNRSLGVVGERHALIWSLDADAKIGRNQHGHTVALKPFMGVMGMPPPEPGVHTTTPPRIWGGNIDCKELVAGSTLYLPIPVSGGLFSVGDGHGRQGDGEVSGTAIECPVERVDLTFHLRDDLALTTPRAHTPAGWLTLGFHEDLNEASLIALGAMLDLMSEQRGLARNQALALASVLVDLRITQIANRVWGVHAVLPHNAL